MAKKTFEYWSAKPTSEYEQELDRIEAEAIEAAQNGQPCPRYYGTKGTVAQVAYRKEKAALAAKTKQNS